MSRTEQNPSSRTLRSSSRKSKRMLPDPDESTKKKRTAFFSSSKDTAVDDNLPASDAATEYTVDIYKYHKDKEALYMHNHLDPNDRVLVVGSLQAVHTDFKLEPASLHLCVKLLDRYCASKRVQRSKAMLVGIAALKLACKFEDARPASAHFCERLRAPESGLQHKHTEIVDMEKLMLHSFDFNLGCPTCYHFLSHFLNAAGYGPASRVAHRASYFSELCLQEHGMIKHKPSLVAAAVVYLATSMASMEEDTRWTPELEEFSGISRDQILPCAQQILNYVLEKPTSPSSAIPGLSTGAVKIKYESPVFLSVAKENPPALGPSGSQKRDRPRGGRN